MKFGSREIALTALFTAMYAIGVIFLAPISFWIYQVRVADALLPLSMVFGFPAVIGLSLGCFVANLYGGLGIIDIFGGAIANFAACTLAWLIGSEGTVRRILGCLVETVITTVIVGSYLSVIFGMPIEASLLGIFIGSLISINLLGFALLESLCRSKIVKSFIVKRD